MSAFKWSLIAVCAMGIVACAETENQSASGSSSQAGSGGNGAGGEGGQAGAGGAAGAGGSMNQGGAGGGGAIQPACFSGLATCNPLTNAGCTGAGEACDYGTKSGKTGFYCYPPPNDVAEGQPCNAGHGPYCAATLHCFGVCKKFCCADTECAQGESCVAFDSMQGTLGFCRDPNACSPAGGPCKEASDCCSMDCHDDHCH